MGLSFRISWRSDLPGGRPSLPDLRRTGPGRNDPKNRLIRQLPPPLDFAIFTSPSVETSSPPRDVE